MEQTMHAAALKFLSNLTFQPHIHVIEIGSRNINGSARQVIPHQAWYGIDLQPGPDVDAVVDAATFSAVDYDLVVCCEVLEHAANWREILGNAVQWLTPSGAMVITCAGPGRRQHSAVDGGELRPGEHYENISVPELREALQRASSWSGMLVQQVGEDTQAVCWR